MLKKFSKFLLFSICTMCAVLLSSCSFDLEYEIIEAPAVTITESQDGRLTVLVSEIRNASSYTIRIDGADTDTYNTYLDVTNIMTDSKTYSISARANAKSGYKSSDFGEEILYSAGSKMGTPELVLYGKVVGWEQDVSASGYTVQIDLPNGEHKIASTSTNRYNFANDLADAGVYTFTVVAHSSKNAVADSETSNAINYVYTKTHTTPVNLSVGEVGDEVVLSFVDPDNASVYTVSIDGTAYNITEKIVSLNDLGHNFDEAKRYYISVKANADLPNHYTASEYSEQVYYDKYLALDMPSGIEILDNDDQLLIRWNAVPHARLYSLYINDEVLAYSQNINATQIVIPKALLDEDGQIGVRLLAEGYDHYLSSLMSNIEYYEEEMILDAPTDLAVQSVGDEVQLGWRDVPNASSYDIEVNGEIVATVDTNHVVLNSYFATADTYTMRVVALPSAESVYVRSNYSGTIVYTYVITLSRPTVNDVKVVGDNYFLYFTGTDTNAQSYRVYLDGNLVVTDVINSPINITGLMSEIGDKNISMQAVASTSSLYRDSALSETFSFDYKSKLAMPTNIKVDEMSNKLYWNAVENAASYSVKINDSLFTSSTNEFDITQYYTNAGEYRFRVVALPEQNSYYVESDYCEIIRLHTITLKAPTNVEAYWDANGKAYVKFDLVEHASNYEINITMNLVEFITPKPTTTSSPFEITNYMTNAGLYTIYVQAIGSGYYYSSPMSNLYQLQKDITLSTPSSIKVEKSNTNESLFVSFKGDENASSYNAIVNGNQITGITTTRFDIKDYVTFEGNYAISIQAVGLGAYTTSEYSSTYTYKHSFTNRYDYARCDVFMNGHIVDYYIDSFDELLEAVWFNYLYNNLFTKSGTTTLKLYLPNGTGNYRSAIIQYFNDHYDTTITSAELNSSAKILSYVLYAYPEYVAFSNFTVSYSGSEYRCTYLNVMEFDHTDKFDYSQVESAFSPSDINRYKQLTYNARNNALQSVEDLYVNERSADFDDFEINSKPTAPVYNSEQLFMVAQYGRQPKFMTENSVAETIYNNAKSVLRKIIGTSYTNYQKVKAIYDWLTIQNVYSYDVIIFSSYVQGGSAVDTVGQFKEFYLEGVLYDLTDSMAVCDGIAKTFTLMCQIEGIDSFKCNGIAGVGDSSDWGGHAWNKVELGGSWYVVDSTWGDQHLQLGYDHVLSATHQYFLVKESYITPTHTEEYPKRTDVTCAHNYNYVGSQHDYGYFGTTKYDYNGETIDLVIGNSNIVDGQETYSEDVILNELKTLIKYCYEHDIRVVEFIMCDAYIDYLKNYNNSAAYTIYYDLVTRAYNASGVGTSWINTEPSSYDKTEPFHYIILDDQTHI